MIWRRRLSYEVYQKRLIRRVFIAASNEKLQASSAVAFTSTPVITGIGQLQAASSVAFGGTATASNGNTLRASSAVAFTSTQSLTGIGVLQGATLIRFTGVGAFQQQKRRGGRAKRLKYVVEVDGEFIPVNTIAEAQMILKQVRDLADQAAERDVKTEVVVKPPRISVKTVLGKKVQSKPLQKSVEQTQRRVRKAYQQRASLNEQLVVQAKQREEHEVKRREQDEEDAIVAILMGL